MLRQLSEALFATEEGQSSLGVSYTIGKVGRLGIKFIRECRGMHTDL